MKRTRVGLAVALTVLSLASPAFADSFLLEERVPLGAPARSLPVVVRSQDQVIVTVSGTRHVLAAQNVTSASLEAVQLTPRAAVAILRLQGNDGAWAALLGGRQGTQLLAFGRTDFHGDPGERSAFSVEASPADANGQRTVTVGARHEGLTLCGGQPALTDRRAVQPETLTLTTDAWSPPASQSVEAQPHVGAAGPWPRVQAYEARGSSSVDELTRTPKSSSALLDRGPAPLELAPYGFATFRAAIPGLSVEKFTLALPTDESRPEELWLLGDEGRALHVRIPREGALVHVPVEPAWPNGCLVLVVGGTKERGKPVRIQELAAFTQVDRPESTRALVSQLVQAKKGHTDPLPILAAMGVEGARALAERYDELAMREKRRSFPLLARAVEAPEVRTRVLDVARGPDPELAEAVLHALEQAREVGRPALRELAKDASAIGDGAAKVLAHDPAELPTLLDALALEGNTNRPALRRALGTVAQRHPERAQEAIEAWLAHAPSVGARAALALALAHVKPLHALLTQVSEQALADANAFEDRYRLALAAGELGPSSSLDGWLEQQAREAEEWMMRHAAFENLAKRNAARAIEHAPTIARDPYPRVRALSPSLLVSKEPALVIDLARKDPWPFVRVAAVSALAADKGARDALLAAVDDPTHSVHATAIETLLAQGEAEAWTKVRERLAKEDEWPEVRTAAVRYAAALCRTDAHEPLLALLRRALRPDADDHDRALGMEALAALTALGGKAAADARAIATREDAPLGVKKAFEQLSLKQRCGVPQA